MLIFLCLNQRLDVRSPLSRNEELYILFKMETMLALGEVLSIITPYQILHIPTHKAVNLGNFIQFLSSYFFFNNT